MGRSLNWGSVSRRPSIFLSSHSTKGNRSRLSASLMEVTTYGRGRYKIGPNKRAGIANVKLNTAARSILSQTGELACVAVVRGWDKFGNRKSTKTEVTIHQQ